MENLTRKIVQEIYQARVNSGGQKKVVQKLNATWLSAASTNPTEARIASVVLSAIDLDNINELDQEHLLMLAHGLGVSIT